MDYQTFRRGDKVYHWKWGWGKILSEPQPDEHLNSYTALVEFEDRWKGMLSIETLSFTEYNLKNGGISYERPDDLEVGEDYITNNGTKVVFDRGEDGWGYGFAFGKWKDAIQCVDPNVWKKVEDTDDRSCDKIMDLLEEEAIRRFGGDWAYAQIKECVFNGRKYEHLNKGIITVEISKRLNGWEIWNKNGCIFYGGKWAEPLEEEEEFEPFQRVLVRNDDSRRWRINRFARLVDSKSHKYECLHGYWKQCISFDENRDLLGTTKSPKL